ncbi:MAG: GPR endopeptidase [Firmicutes bacterium HGW-Firmicutes-16]|nr:MAG: GPR endopeptidase [Firmicutes bacterium HGW-Firmicutes-16]
MERFVQRTDLAAESRELAMSGKADDVEGTRFEEGQDHEVKYQKLEVFNEAGQNAIGKPIGTYYTAEIASVLRRESETFTDTVGAVSALIKNLLGETKGEGCTLVVGLGNRDITPDVIGPLCTESVLVTRHLKEHAPKDFEFLSPVAAISPGVLGTSGIESADYIKWVCDNLKPERVIAIDALAARNLDRLCRTVQITDTGITPGSGVGNSRSAINKDVLGVPVIAIGIPTVVDIRSLLVDMGDGKVSEKAASTNDMIVTPRNIDSEVVCASRVVAYAINLALHEGLTVEDIDMMVG